MAQVSGSDGPASGLGPPVSPYGVWGDSGPTGKTLKGKPPDYGTGVIGTSLGIGVEGLTQAGVGVSASATDGEAVRAVSGAGVGLHVENQSQARPAVEIFNNSGVGINVLSETDCLDAISQRNYCINARVVSGTAIQAESDGGVGIRASCKQGVAGYFEGDIQTTGDVVLLNAGSGDIAEDFDLDDDPLTAEPGTVLVIGHDGRLSASDAEYDTRVAGVVSGAASLRPAVVLQRVPSSNPRSPIALVGKVFCKVDATTTPIAAGDLLTTSPARGHAMKVTDRSRAVGAVLGKALGPMPSGRALIPILVSLR